MARMVPLDFDADRRLVGEFVDVAPASSVSLDPS